MRCKSLSAAASAPLFLLLLLCLPLCSQAQHRWTPPHPPRRDPESAGAIQVRITTVRPYRNMISGLGHFGGINGYANGGFGMDYEFFPGRESNFSVQVPLFVFWGADGRAGKTREGEVRTNINGYFLTPGCLYHPFGNAQKTDLAIGLGAAVGRFNRVSTTYHEYGPDTVARFNDPLPALTALLQLNLHTQGSYIFGIYIHAGPVLSDIGPRLGNSGLLWQFGIKMGGAW